MGRGLIHPSDLRASLEDRFAHALHGPLRAFCAFFAPASRIPQTFSGCASKSFAARLNRLDPGDQIFGHQLLAIDATDRRGAAVAVHLVAIVSVRRKVCARQTRDKSPGVPDRFALRAAGPSSCCGLSRECRPADRIARLRCRSSSPSDAHRCREGAAFRLANRQAPEALA